MAETEIRRIEHIERLHLSVNGNPRFRFTFSNGDEAISKSDAAFCYMVGNPGMRAGDTVVVALTPAGRIRSMSPYKERT